MEYGAPIRLEELDKDTRKHLSTYCSDLIQETIRKNQSLL